MKKQEETKEEVEIKTPHPLLIKTIIIFSCIIVILFCFMRFWSHKFLIIKEYPIIEETLSSNWNGFKIVHFSDIHFGNTINEKELDKLVEKINLIRADIVVFTGDLFDKNIVLSDKNIDTLKNELKKINANIKKLAICGDNDYTDIDLYHEIMNNAEFQILENENVLIYQNGMNPIQIAGITSVQQQEYDVKKSLTTEEEKIEYRILLSHEPIIIDEVIDDNINLILSGHSLGGSIRLPGTDGIIKKEYTSIYQSGFYQKNETKLYVSSGLGTENYYYRFFNSPSIQLYRFYNY